MHQAQPLRSAAARLPGAWTCNQIGAIRPPHLRACKPSIPSVALSQRQTTGAWAYSSEPGVHVIKNPGPHLPLTCADSVHQYLATRPGVLKHIQSSLEDVISIQELGEGLINHVYKVTCRPKADGMQGGHNTSLLIKYAPPYVKSSRLKLAQVRMDVEARAMQLVHACCPGGLPQLLEYDSSNNVLVMQFLDPPLVKVFDGIHHHGHTYTHLPHRLAVLLASVYTTTTQDALTPAEYRRYVDETFANTQIMTLNEQVVLTDPMDPACPSNRRHTNTAVRHAIDEFRSDPVVQSAHAQVLHSFRHDRQVLLHNDLHFANLLAHEDQLYCIDWEFAGYGPMSFDLGSILAVQLLALLVLGAQARATTPQQAAVKHEQQEWLLLSVVELWESFIQEYEARQPTSAARTSAPPSDALESHEGAHHQHCLSQESSTPWSQKEHVSGQANSNTELAPPSQMMESGSPGLTVQVSLQQHRSLSDGNPTIKEHQAMGSTSGQHWPDLYQDVVGFAGFCMFRLTAGIHSYAGYELIGEEEAEARCRVRAVGLALALLRMRGAGGVLGPADVVCMARDYLD